jgi:hypothetical protein
MYRLLSLTPYSTTSSNKVPLLTLAQVAKLGGDYAPELPLA